MVMQLPQCALSVCSFTQVPVQLVKPALQAHTPPMHVVPVAPAGHWVTQSPQWLLSLFSSTQAPLQLVSRLGHAHTPP
jgi:hypothetical protein